MSMVSLDYLYDLAHRGVCLSALNYSHFSEYFYSSFFKRAQAIFSSKTRTTWLEIDGLSYSAIHAIVAKTLHQPKDECIPLARLVHGISHGNAFSARNFLSTLQRQNLVRVSILEWT
jgi:predicted ATPase